MILLIRDQLTFPPSSFALFRTLTLYCHKDFCSAILIETDDPDPVWRWLKARGGMDYVRELIRPGTQDGLRLDVSFNLDPCIVTDRIDQNNFHYLVAKIQAHARNAGYGRL